MKRWGKEKKDLGRYQNDIGKDMSNDLAEVMDTI